MSVIDSGENAFGLIVLVIYAFVLYMFSCPLNASSVIIARNTEEYYPLSAIVIT